MCRIRYQPVRQMEGSQDVEGFGEKYAGSSLDDG